MPEGTGIGVYPFGEVGYARENEEVSSTYEGRHLTVLASQISSHDPSHELQQKGHPLVVGENIVGVAFKTEVLGADLIPFDTEGIWLLSVVALNPASVAVVAGDELFINKSTGIISNDPNKNTHCHFGYALGGVKAGQTAIISVKVHWDPDDAEEVVGLEDAPYVNDEAGKVFREYHYEAGGGGVIEGERMSLSIDAPCVTACVKYVELFIGDEAGGRMITGRSSVIEAVLTIAVGTGDLRTMSVLVLDFDNKNITYTISNIDSSYIALRERSTSETMKNLFNFMDHEADIGTLAPHAILTTNTNTATHSIRCIVGTQVWHILCSNVNPA